MEDDKKDDGLISLLAQEANHDLLISINNTKTTHGKLVEFRNRFKKKNFGLVQFKKVVLRAYGELIKIKHPHLYTASDYASKNKTSSVLDEILSKTIYLYNLNASK